LSVVLTCHFSDLPIPSSFIFFLWYAPPLCLRCFPTRRSSDLLPRHVRGVPVEPERLAVVDRLQRAHARPVVVGDLAGVHLVRERSEEHTSELQSRENLVCRRLPEKT